MGDEKTSRRKFLKDAAPWACLAALGGLAGRQLYKAITKPDLPEWLESLRNGGIKFSLAEFDYKPKPGKRALLVQHGNLDKDNIQIMNYLLRKEGYKCDVLEPSKATEEEIFKTVEQMASEADDNHQTIFYYTGEGHVIDKWYSSAIAVNGDQNDIYKRRITPLELFDCIGKVRGKKAIILDACHSGEFVDYLKDLDFHEMALGENVIDDYVAIVSCPADCVSIRSIYFVRGKLVGSLTFGLYELLSSSKEPVNLSKVEILCGNAVYRAHVDKLNQLHKSLGYPPISFEMQRTFDTDFFL